METIIIESIDDFNKYYAIFKETARVKAVCDVFVIGLDTEFIMKANYPEAFANSQLWNEYVSDCGVSVCVLQIASKSMCLVINLVKMGLPMPKNLKSLLKNDSWIKVGVGVDLDLKYLSDNYGLGHCGGTVEIKNLAYLAIYKNPSLDSIFNILIGVHKKKSNNNTSLCDWSKDLTYEQLEYAARDAIMSLHIFNDIISPSIDHMMSSNTTCTDTLLAINFVDKCDEKKSIICNSRTNYIGKLNEFAMKNGLEYPNYCGNETIETGKKKSFSILCLFEGHVTEGIASSKKKAKHEAAKEMWKIYKSDMEMMSDKSDE